MENVVSDTKFQSNSSDKNSNNKYKDIEEAIQKAIDTQTIRKDNVEKSFKSDKTE